MRKGFAAAAERWLTGHLKLVFVGLAALYAAGAVAKDFSKALWYDEIVSHYLAHLPSVATIWDALAHGADTLPIFYLLLARWSQELLGFTPLATRLPESLGFGIMCVCIFIFTRKYTPALHALGAALFPFATRANYYVSEGRPYGLYLGFAGLILICWQAAGDQRKRWIALPGLAIFVACAVCSHYLAVLILIPIGLGQLVRRRFDFGVWAALLVGLSSLAFILPLIRGSHGYVAGFWAGPSLGRLLSCYTLMFAPSVTPILALIGGLFLVVVLFPAPEECPNGTIPLAEGVTAGSLLLLPFFALGISLVTKTLSPSYVMPMVIGASMVGAMLLSRLTARPMTAGLLFAAIGLLGFTSRQAGSVLHFRPQPPKEELARRLLHRPIPTDLPVVVDDGIQFLELWAIQDPDVNSRIVSVSDARWSMEYVHASNTDLNLLGMRKYLPMNVYTYDEFTGAHRSFLILWTYTESGWFFRKVRAAGATIQYVMSDGGAMLLRVDLP